MVEILKKDEMTWRKLSPEDSECARLGELKTFTEGTGKEGPCGVKRELAERPEWSRACVEGRRGTSAGWGDLGGGCRAGRAPEESELMGQQEGGSGGLPAGELEEKGLRFLHARMAVNFACLWKSSNIGRQGGCLSLVGEAGGTKGKEETAGEEYRGPRRPAGKVLP